MLKTYFSHDVDLCENSEKRISYKHAEIHKHTCQLHKLHASLKTMQWLSMKGIIKALYVEAVTLKFVLV